MKLTGMKTALLGASCLALTQGMAFAAAAQEAAAAPASNDTIEVIVTA
mgnify:CR=1 FL=1